MWRERKPTRCNNQMFIINCCLNMFQASLCPSSGEQRPCVNAYGVLRWFCWMWLVAVVGCCAPQPLPTTSSRTSAVHQCINTHEEGHNDAWNMLRQKLIINIWLLHLVGFLSLHTLLMMYGHRNLRLKLYVLLGIYIILFHWFFLHGQFTAALNLLTLLNSELQHF